jgi:hypothetical protein
VIQTMSGWLTTWNLQVPADDMAASIEFGQTAEITTMKQLLQTN